MHCQTKILRCGLQFVCKSQQRLLSFTKSIGRVVTSPFPDIELPTVSLPEYVWERVDQWPEKVAFECGVTGRRYRYAEARKLCKRFAASLQRSGLQPGNTLAIVMPNTAEWPIVMLGAIESGLRITTVNPAYTAEEISRQLKDCEVQMIVTIAALYPTVQQAVALSSKLLKPQIIISPGIDHESAIPSGTIDLRDMLQHDIDTSRVSFAGRIDDAVIIPYSSGTTGLPKGVLLNHRCLVANCAQINGAPEICLSEPAIGMHQDVAPVVLPFFHIYGMCVLMMAKVAHGVKLVTLPKFEPHSFFKVLDEHEATVLYVAPPLVLFLASHPGVQTKHLRSLRYLVSGAAPVGRLDIERFLKRAPRTVGALQGYGMTETSPVITHMTKGSTNYESVGMPLPNTDMKIIHTETKAMLGQGDVGEICTKGPQIMEGYFNRPEATAEMIDSDGWLHTGDLGYYDENGCFYVVDRLKELIKVKGFQVAPAELEEILRSHPDVQDAAVIGVPDERSGEVPRAFVVPKGPNISKENIKKFVASKVTDYKQLRGGIEFIDNIPKNPSGKILRRKLKELP